LYSSAHGLPVPLLQIGDKVGGLATFPFIRWQPLRDHFLYDAFDVAVDEEAAEQQLESKLRAALVLDFAQHHPEERKLESSDDR
jgi:hypothetical protein